MSQQDFEARLRRAVESGVDVPDEFDERLRREIAAVLDQPAADGPVDQFETRQPTSGRAGRPVWLAAAAAVLVVGLLGALAARVAVRDSAPSATPPVSTVASTVPPAQDLDEACDRFDVDDESLAALVRVLVPAIDAEQDVQQDAVDEASALIDDAIESLRVLESDLLSLGEEGERQGVAVIAGALDQATRELDAGEVERAVASVEAARSQLATAAVCV